MNDYIKIDWPEVRAGDVLMHENGDRLTVRAVEYVMGLPPVVAALNVRLHPDSWASAGFTLYRKAEPVPTVPGAYHDKNGVLCVLAPRSPGDPYPWLITHGGARSHWTNADGEYIAERAPFTRLVPMPSSDAVMEAVQRAEPMCRRERITDAVMALLRGGDDE